VGCDIHMVLERRDHEKNRWVGIDTFLGGKAGSYDAPYCFARATSRNYRRFAQLAGVRGDGPAPLGLPADISETTDWMVRDWGADGHSHSWLPAADAARIFFETEWWKDKEPNAFQKKWPESFYFGIESEHLGDFRLIFWFDN
jgi:hypothetical protein